MGGGTCLKGSVLGSAPVKQREGKTRTVETTQRPAQKGRQGQQNRTRKQNHRHRTQKAAQGAAGNRKQEQSFSSPVSCAVLGPAPLFYTPAVSSLDTDPGVATLAFPTARWRAPAPVNKWPLCAGPSAVRDRR